MNGTPKKGIKVSKRSFQRSEAQNDSLHLYFTQVAQELNREGFDVRVVLQVIQEKGVDMFWSKELVKELLWRTIQKKHLKKHSTTELDSIGEIDQIYEMLNKWLGENFGIHVPFPSKKTLMEKQK